MAQALLAPASLLNSSVGCTKVRKFGVLKRPLSLASSFTQGSCHAYNINAHKRKVRPRTMSLTIRCEQSANESQGAIVWLGRLAMVSFATAITIEISTGKGLLENIGLATPQYSLAFFVTALVIGLVALFIFQSSSRN
ncbi:stress enhanced protein 1, chloroplastic-like [Carex rostrata]